ncbi:capsid protein [Plant associated genomovirus 20]|uniref:Capsid protein n=1 Tax=Plant associated genomovirus 20 TaxID=2584392 RepID=A0A4Y5QD43_9VIRU|nr:capsid protein [Plant associated genomovirus 20]QCX29496.1 capsid protein [Plant associated genomovirus 20]
MAYTRTRSRRGYRRRTYARRRRRPVAKRRYRRRPYTRTKRMSTRTLRNITSRKKRDTMIPWRRLDPFTSGAVALPTLSGVPGSTNPGIQPYVFAYIPTARNIDRVSGAVANIQDDSSRTSTNCFAVGLKESITLNLNGAAGWYWRRICFYFKSRDLMDVSAASGFGTVGAAGTFYEETSVGFPRAWTLLAGQTTPTDNTTALWIQMRSALFRGTYQTDWLDFITAKTDNKRLDIVYDKTRRIQSPNAKGTSRKFNMWHSMRRRLVYNDDEVGGGKQTDVALSSQSRDSAGDYYVIDIFRSNPDALVSEGLEIDSSSTYYWHET